MFFENLCYKDVNLKNVIGSYLMFYSEVYQYSILGNTQVKHLKNIVVYCISSKSHIKIQKKFYFSVSHKVRCT